MAHRPLPALIALLAAVLCVVACGPAPETSGPSQERRDAARGQRSPTETPRRYDLARDEQRGGHTLARHVGRTDDELRERLEREHISAASTWTAREIAETTVAEALVADRGRIEKWMRRGYPRPNLALRYDAGHVIGRTLQRGASQSLPSTEAVIVLKADGPDGYYVLTTYPEARE